MSMTLTVLIYHKLVISHDKNVFQIRTSLYFNVSKNEHQFLTNLQS